MINWHFVSHFIKHYWSATRIDVLHSPFVFELYNSCIARKKYNAELAPIENIKQAALRNNTPITQLDFGALGAKQKQRTKPVSYFAKTHAKPTRLAYILHQIIKKYSYKNCLELGTSLGFTTMYLAKALPNDGVLYSIEGAPEIATIAQQHIEQAAISNKVQLHVGNFNNVLPKLLQQMPLVDFAFIDGNHTYEATMDYFNQLLPKVTEQSVIVFDDIYWSEGMTRAWQEIKAHPQVNVTVDLFYIGLVYFRTAQVEEHFKLRVW
jgi:predicted O-methyltransferase YrrM